MVHPRDGGCWYCHQVGGEMSFSCEFDTWVHLPCLYKAAKDEDNREAAIMAREFNISFGVAQG